LLFSALFTVFNKREGLQQLPTTTTANNNNNNKIAIATQGGDDANGHSSLSQQPTMKLTTLINTMVLKRLA
jgi:hypothetical protein